MTSSTTDRRLGLSGNSAIKTPCMLATTANITLSGEQTIDSVSATSGDRILVKDQTTGANNGIYVCDTGTWERDLDFDGTYDCQQGTLVLVTQGSSNGAGLFELTTTDPITIGTTSLTFVKIATLAASAVTQIQVQNGQFVVVGTIAGTNTITGTTVGTAPTALGAGQYVFFVPANSNTGAATFNRDSKGAVNVFYNGAALIGGELQANVAALIYHDGTQYQLISSARGNSDYQTTGSVASATTTVLNTAAPYSQITGTTTITAITLGNGRMRIVEFAASLTLTNSASLILPTGANISTSAGDTATFIGEGSSVTRCIFYQRATGASLTASTVQPMYIQGLTYSNGTDATNDINIATGQATDATGAYSMALTSALGKQSDVVWAVGGTTAAPAGWLDTGAVGNSDYYMWLIARSDTGVVDSLCSLSSTAPTMPASYTYKRLIGWFRRTGGTIVAMTTYETEGGGIDLRWTVPTLDVNLANTLTTSRRVDAVKVPLNITTLALLAVVMSDVSAVGIARVCCPDETDAAPSSTAAPLANVDWSTAVSTLTQLEVRTSATGTVAARSNLATVDLYGVSTIGFKFARRV